MKNLDEEYFAHMFEETPEDTVGELVSNVIDAAKKGQNPNINTQVQKLKNQLKPKPGQNTNDTKKTVSAALQKSGTLKPKGTISSISNQTNENLNLNYIHNYSNYVEPITENNMIVWNGMPDPNEIIRFNKYHVFYTLGSDIISKNFYGKDILKLLKIQSIKIIKLTDFSVANNYLFDNLVESLDDTLSDKIKRNLHDYITKIYSRGSRKLLTQKVIDFINKSNAGVEVDYLTLEELLNPNDFSLIASIDPSEIILKGEISSDYSDDSEKVDQEIEDKAIKVAKDKL